MSCFLSFLLLLFPSFHPLLLFSILPSLVLCLLFPLQWCFIFRSLPSVLMASVSSVMPLLYMISFFIPGSLHTFFSSSFFSSVSIPLLDSKAVPPLHNSTPTPFLAASTLVHTQIYTPPHWSQSPWQHSQSESCNRGFPLMRTSPSCVCVCVCIHLCCLSKE